MNTADVDPERAARAICEMSARRNDQTPHAIVELLVDRYGMDEVAKSSRQSSTKWPPDFFRIRQ